MNSDLLRRVADKIEQSPDRYNQYYYVAECGTKFCIAGWVCILLGCTFDGRACRTSSGDLVLPSSFAAEALGIPVEITNNTIFAPRFKPFGERATAASIVKYLRQLADGKINLDSSSRNSEQLNFFNVFNLELIL